MNKKNKAEWDDGRVIADMNIDGMPWNKKDRSIYKKGDNKGENAPTLTKEERKMYTRSAVLAGLVVALIFLVIIFLFILFSINVWFR